MNNRLHKRMPRKWYLVFGSVVVMLSLVITLLITNSPAKATVDFTDLSDKNVGLEVVVTGESEEVTRAETDFTNAEYGGLTFDFYLVASVINVDGYEAFQYEITDSDYKSALGAYTAADIIDTEKFDGATRAETATGYATNSKWGAFTNVVADTVLGLNKAPAFTMNYGEKVDGSKVTQAGLYLIVPRGKMPEGMSYFEKIDGAYGADTVVTHAYSQDRIYTFAPELVSFPSYRISKLDADGNPVDVVRDNATIDDITYDLTSANNSAVTLKYIAEEREVYINIVKTLTSHEEDKKLKEPVTVVFSVYATKGVDAAGNPIPVFDSVYSMVISNASVDSIEVGPIPAGADVTVTEEYAGAGYKCVSAPSETIEKISADVDQVFTFTNEYDDNKGGGSVVNKFTSAESADGAIPDGNGRFWTIEKGFHNAEKKVNE